MINLVVNFEIGNVSSFTNNKQGSEITSLEHKLFDKMRKQGCFFLRNNLQKHQANGHRAIGTTCWVLCTLS